MVFLSTFLCAPSQRPEPGTVRKLLNGTTEYAETGDVHAEPLQIQALVCRPIIVLFHVHACTCIVRTGVNYGNHVVHVCRERAKESGDRKRGQERRERKETQVMVLGTGVNYVNHVVHVCRERERERRSREIEREDRRGERERDTG